MTDAPESDAPESDALTAVVDGALERALLAETDSRRYFALAGAVERARGDAVRGPDGSDGSVDADGPSDTDGPTAGGPDDRLDDSLSAALVCTVAVSALSSSSPGPTWTPPDPRTELVAAGAVRATRRFDADPERVAARAGLPLSDLRSRLSRNSAEDGR